jgi:hypothetical protein
VAIERRRRVEGGQLIRRRNGDEHLVLFDDADAETLLAHTWNLQSNHVGKLYVRTNIRKPDGGFRRPPMHVMLLGPGTTHLNGNGLDNRRDNLRPPARGSDFKGVYWNRKNRCWTAWIKVAGRTQYVGSSPSEEEAARAYDYVARELLGDAAPLNFPAERE